MWFLKVSNELVRCKMGKKTGGWTGVFPVFGCAIEYFAILTFLYL